MIASIRGKKPHVYRVIILKQMADHNSLGTVPCDYDSFTTRVSGLATTTAASLIIRGDILSRPLALLALRLEVSEQSATHLPIQI